MVTEPHVHPFLRANIWHLRGRDRDLIVDTGLGVASLQEALPALFARQPAVVITHAHLDHMGGAHEFEACYAHPTEAITQPTRQPATLGGPELVGQLGLSLAAVPMGLPEWMITALPRKDFDAGEYQLRPARKCISLSDGDEIDLGDRSFRVLVLPGHSPGSIALFDERSGELFTGDVLYELGPAENLLDDIHGANIELYVSSMRRLRELPITVVYPGHGRVLSKDHSVAIIDRYLQRRTPEGRSPLITASRRRG